MAPCPVEPELETERVKLRLDGAAGLYLPRLDIMMSVTGLGMQHCEVRDYGGVTDRLTSLEGGSCSKCNTVSKKLDFFGAVDMTRNRFTIERSLPCGTTPSRRPHFPRHSRLFATGTRT
jgi:hypothetical protein